MRRLSTGEGVNTETHTEVEEHWAKACDLAGLEVLLERKPVTDSAAVGQYVEIGGRSRIVQWERRFFVEKWVAALTRRLYLSTQRWKHKRDGYVHADLRFAAKHADAFASAYMLGGEDGMLSLRRFLLDSGADADG